jgi:hypothetical protein
MVGKPVSCALNLTFVHESFDAISATETVLTLARESELVEGTYRILGQRAQTPTAKLLSQLKKKKEPFFGFEGETLSARIFPTRATGVTSFELTFQAATPPIEQLDAWIPRLANAGIAIHGRLTDPDWERWQNEEMLQNFETVGKPTAGLKLRWDTDWERDVVDVSVNPGRSLGREGYVEVLGHEMWLMPAFWPKSGANKSAIKRALPTRSLPADILAVTLSTSAFSDENPPSEEVRKLLFPE